MIHISSIILSYLALYKPHYIHYLNLHIQHCNIYYFQIRKWRLRGFSPYTTTKMFEPGSETIFNYKVYVSFFVIIILNNASSLSAVHPSKYCLLQISDHSSLSTTYNSRFLNFFIFYKALVSLVPASVCKFHNTPPLFSNL